MKHLERTYKKYSQYCFYIAFHLYRSFLIWLHGLILKPLETIVDTFLKHEPEETQWVQLYSLTSCTYNSDFGVEMISYNSAETYLCPMTNYFDLFIQNEYDLFLKYSVKPPKYDHEFDQIPEIVETLFVVRKEDDGYIFRTFPPKQWNYKHDEKGFLWEKSSIQFVIVEYKHPKMMNQIELKIPESFYLVNNEILSPAFIQRLLELQRSYYVFDVDYEVVLIDDNMESQKLSCLDYVKIEKNSYKICQISSNIISETEDVVAVVVEEENQVVVIEEPEQVVEEESMMEWELMKLNNVSQFFLFICCLFMGVVNPLGLMLHNNNM
jgi:hypothetical protein